MGFRFYDKALVEKIKKWTKNTKMRVLSPDEVQRLWNINADDNNDEPLQLPLIALSRDRNIEIQTTGKTPMSFDGIHVESNEKNTLQLNAIPATLSYQLDIYTRRYDEGDEYLRNFIFNFINYPKMTIQVPYNGANLEIACFIQLQSTASDNSDISERLFPGQFTRWTLQLSISPAYLFSAPVNENASIEYEFKEPEFEIQVDSESSGSTGITITEPDK